MKNRAWLTVALVGLLAGSGCGMQQKNSGSLNTDPVTCSADDADCDGLTDTAEQQIGLDPHNPDSDGDGKPDALDKLWLAQHPEYAYLIMATLTSLPKILTGKEGDSAPATAGASSCSPAIDDGTMSIDDLTLALTYRSHCGNTDVQVRIKGLEIVGGDLFNVKFKFKNFDPTLTTLDGKKIANDSISVTGTVDETLIVSGKQLPVKGTINKPFPIPANLVFGSDNSLIDEARFVNPACQEITGFESSLGLPQKAEFVKWRGQFARGNNSLQWEWWQKANSFEIRDFALDHYYNGSWKYFGESSYGNLSCPAAGY